MKRALPVVLLGLGAIVACRSADDVRRDKADRIEQVYGLAPAEARAALSQHSELAEAAAERAFQRVKEAFALPRLAPEDVGAFTQVAKDEKLLDALCAEPVVTLATKLRLGFRYEMRFSEAQALVDAAKNPGVFQGAIVESRPEKLDLLRARAPIARMPLAAIEPAAALARVPQAGLERSLARFGALEIDLGVQELDPRVIELLAVTASDPKQEDALAALVRNLPALQVRLVELPALATVAEIPSSTLAFMLERLGPTHLWRSVIGWNGAEEHYVHVLSERPRSTGIVSLLEEADPDFSMSGDLAEAKALVALDAASPDGHAREALAEVMRAHVPVDLVDAKVVSFLRELVANRPLRESVIALHSAFGGWRPVPRELPALAILAEAPNPGPVARALRTLGFDLANRQLSSEEATSLASLARGDASAMISGLHVVFPRLSVRNAASLSELEQLAKAGVSRDDVLRLDADSLQGPLDAAKRKLIVEKAHKSG
jgi:hypothetical protein